MLACAVGLAEAGSSVRLLLWEDTLCFSSGGGAGCSCPLAGGCGCGEFDTSGGEDMELGCF